LIIIFKLKAELAAKEEERRKKEEEDRKANVKVLEEMVATLKSIQSQNSEMSELVKTYQTQVNGKTI
jgi:Tfp pilus assembly protein PilO